MNIANFDPEIGNLINLESERQQNTLDLIASENIASSYVLQACGSVLMNKYAEGYPGKRYYGGCEIVDSVEAVAIERAKSLFQAEFSNVQPHSGTQASLAAYYTFLTPGDTVLAMNLSHGGHLTHGSPVNLSGKLFDFIHYGVDEKTGVIDYDLVASLAYQHRPKMIVAGGSAYSRMIDFSRFSKIASEIDAYFKVDMAHFAGLVAAGIYPSPIPYADVITSTTHKTMRGPRGGFILAKSEYGPKINAQIFPGSQGGPLLNIIAAKAIAFKEAQSDSFKKYQLNVLDNAKYLADKLSDFGLSVVSGTTDTHMFLLDLTNANITGRAAEISLGEAGILVNKNTIPGEKRSPFVTSGIRIGTSTATSRGMGKTEMELISELIVTVLRNADNDQKLVIVKRKIEELCQLFPIPKTQMAPKLTKS